MAASCLEIARLLANRRRAHENRHVAPEAMSIIGSYRQVGLPVTPVYVPEARPIRYRYWDQSVVNHPVDYSIRGTCGALLPILKTGGCRPPCAGLRLPPFAYAWP